MQCRQIFQHHTYSLNKCGNVASRVELNYSFDKEAIGIWMLSLPLIHVSKNLHFQCDEHTVFFLPNHRLGLNWRIYFDQCQDLHTFSSHFGMLARGLFIKLAFSSSSGLVHKLCWYMKMFAISFFHSIQYRKFRIAFV